MRARNIKPGFFKNEDLGTADPVLSLLFAGLWCLADRDGLLEDRPARIAAEVFPYRAGVNVDAMLSDLERMGLIQRYRASCLTVDPPLVNGGSTVKTLIKIVKFLDHQTPHKTERKSVLPQPDASSSRNNGALTVDPPLVNVDTGSGTAAPPSDSPCTDSLIPDSPNHDSSIPDSPCKRKPPAAADPRDAIPDSLRTPGFLAAWDTWAAHRRERRQPGYKPTALKSLLAKLAGMGPERAADAIRFSIENNWLSIHEDQRAPPSKSRSVVDQVAKNAQGFIERGGSGPT
jgi:hypothetical protein